MAFLLTNLSISTSTIMKKPSGFTWAALGLSALLIGSMIYRSRAPGDLDAFASCLAEKKAVFYGAFWCPHCQRQKKLFGRSERLLPYVECSLPSGQGQTRECADKNITGYPTWMFADDSRETGELSLQRLAEKTGCPLETQSKKSL